jgi:hypothetical protein
MERTVLRSMFFALKIRLLHDNLGKDSMSTRFNDHIDCKPHANTMASHLMFPLRDKGCLKSQQYSITFCSLLDDYLNRS